MAEWIDFEDIRARVSLEDVIYRYYGGFPNLQRKGNKVTGPCPVHGGDSKRAFHADLDKNVWKCFSRNHGGNQIDFVMQKEDISVREAALLLKHYFLSNGNGTDDGHRGGNGSNGSGHSDSSESRAPTNGNSAATPRHERDRVRRDTEPDLPALNPALSVTLTLRGDHPHLVRDRALRPETVEHFGVGYCSKGIMRGCIAIPVHDEEGTLVAYAGRRLKPQAIREEGKYKLPKGFQKQLVLYNFHRAVPLAAEQGLILVEGFFTVLALYEAGLQNVVAAMGTELSEYQARMLSQARDVTILFDGDDAGWTGGMRARETLQSQGLSSVRVVRLPAGFEPEHLSQAELRWLLEGLGLGLTEIAFCVPEPALTLVPELACGSVEPPPQSGSARCARE